jgi:YVTN family beta-propeller protein
MTNAKTLLFWMIAVTTSSCAAAYVSPEYLAVSPDSKTLYVTAATAGKVVLVDTTRGTPTGQWPLAVEPSGIAVASDGAVFVTGRGAGGGLYKFDATGKLLAKARTGHTPVAPIVAADGKTVYVLNRFDDSVAAVDANLMTVKATIPAVREPCAAAIAGERGLLFVANLLPKCSSQDRSIAASVSVIDTTTFKLVDHVMLPNGSIGLRGVAAAPDGRFIYVTHSVGRYQLPVTQLERGWVSTAALSGLDGESGRYINTVILDDIDLGAANPWSVAVSRDGKNLVVCHAGTHEISVIDREKLHARLEGAAAHQPVTDVARSAADVPNDLSFLVGIRRRIAIEGRGPRGLAIVGNRVYVAAHFSDALAVLDLSAVAPKPAMIPLGTPANVNADRVRQGEMLWNDATTCFQQWASCATCHPDARIDGLNWDLLNDGFGNPKNTRSMLMGTRPGPMMALGVRRTLDAAVRAGITHVQFAARPEDDVERISDYLASLRPIPSPRLIDGQLSPAAERGRRVFFDDAVGCAECHPLPTYSDGKSHDVRSDGAYDRRADKFYTPSLLECWRTAPYMHDGRYLTIRDLIVRGKHGIKKDELHLLSEQQIDDLVEFVLSL